MSHLNKQTILMVDSNAITRQKVGDQLRQVGYITVEASNDQQCLEQHQRHSPALVIISASVPTVFELCRRLKSLFSTPVLVMSAQDDTLIDCAFVAGADDWIVEQPHSALLRKRVQQLMNGQTNNEHQLRAQQQIEKTLYYIAQGAWGLSSEDFLRALIIYLGKTLNADNVFIGEMNADNESINTVAMYSQGQIISNYSYAIANTPCEHVFANKLTYFEREVQALFPFDTLLAEMDIESYIGIPLWSTSGQAIGILSVLDTKPLEQVQLTTSLLQLVAVRAAHELERTRHERALREAEEFARSTLDGLAEYIAIIDTDGTILAVNKAWRSFATMNGGLTAVTNEGENYLKACETAANSGSEDAALVAIAIREILNGTRSHFELEYDCHTPTEQRWFVARITRFPGEGVSRAIVAHNDITMRKHYESALRESEARYQSVIMALVEGVVVQDSNGMILTCNASAERILGITIDQMSGRTPLDLNWRAFYEDGTPVLTNNHPSIVTLKTGEPQYATIMKIHKPDGSLIWVSINTEPLYRVGETVPYAAVASIIDITASKQAENALRLSEERYRVISELISDYAFSFLVKEDGTLEREWNTDSFQLITGYMPEIADGKERNLYHVDDRKRVTADIEAVLAGQPGVAEYRVVTADGETKWVQVYRQPVFDAQGRVVRMYSVTCDISAEKWAEEALVEQKRLEAVLNKERELNAFRTNLMRTLSHEFRTPLAIISTACDLLEHYMERATHEQRKQKISNIRAQIDRLTEMMDDISIIAQNTLNRITPRLIKLDLEDLTLGCVQEVQQSMGARHHLTFLSDGNIGEMTLDKRLMQRAISNLLTNAVKYSAEGTKISTRIFREGDSVVIQVEDQGIGMSEQDQQYVFEPFYRANVVNGITGTGLGLSIVRECIALMQGTVHVKSELGVGSTFVMRLPSQQSANR